MEKNKGPGRYVRRRYLIAKQFQLKYTFMIVIFMFLIAWLAGYTVYYTVFTLLGERLANLYPQARLSAIFKTVNITLLVRMALLVPFVVIVSIILSHRIAGPVFRMERYLGEVAKGDFSSILKLRRRDELKNLAEAINGMRRGLGRISQENQELVAKLSSTVDELNTELEKPTLNRERVITLSQQANGQITELKERFSQYRT